MALTYDRPEKVFLFGGTKLLTTFADWLDSQDIRTNVLTAPRQYATLECGPHQALSVSDVNEYASACGGLCVTDSTLGICFGPAWQFGPEIRQAFGNRLIDFMSIPFPFYKGGAHTTWATLHNEKNWGCCMQLVTENTKQGVCHDGEVLCSTAFRYATDMDANYLSFLKGFIGKCDGEHEFTGRGYDSGCGSTFPRLNTAINGWIDWSWTTDEVVRFINAFTPYGGASSVVRGHRVYLKDAYAIRDKSHPFTAGIISGHDEDHRFIIQGRDTAFVAEIDSQVAFAYGDRLVTDQESLRTCKRQVQYDANGVFLDAVAPSRHSQFDGAEWEGKPLGYPCAK